MGENIITADQAAIKEHEKDILRLEIAEMKEISELLFKKLDKKIQVIEKLESALDQKIAIVQQTMEQSETIISGSVDSGESPLISSAVEQVLRNSEAAPSQSVAATEASVDKKIASLCQVVQRAELLVKKIQPLLSLEAEVEKKIVILEQVIQRAAAMEKKLQSVASQEASIDKKIGALEMLARRSDAMNSLGGTSNRQHEIISLHHKGLKTMEIGEVLAMPVGEVELILELFPQRS